MFDAWNKPQFLRGGILRELRVAQFHVAEVSLAAEEAIGAFVLAGAGLVERGMVGIYVVGSEQIDDVATQIAVFEALEVVVANIRWRLVDAILPEVVFAVAGLRREGEGEVAFGIEDGAFG